MAQQRRFRKYLPTGEMVLKYQIVGTNIWVFNAWRPAHENDTGSTICWEQSGEWIQKHQVAERKLRGEVDGLRQWVKIGTDPDVSIYEDLKVGWERSEAVQRAYTNRYAVAHALIFQAFPELLDMLGTDEASKVHIGGGEVELHLEIDKVAR